MTLLVGVKSAEGVVIAADQQATHGALGTATVGVPTTKVHVLGTDGLFASSGPIGLGQQLHHIVESEHGEFSKRKFQSLLPNLQKKFREILDPAFQTARHAAGIIGGNAASMDVLCASLLAAPFKDGLIICEIGPQAGVEVLTDKIPFVCIGSGKPNADPFLGYLWSVFFKSSTPTLAEASLMAYWTVQRSIAAKSTGVGFGVDLYTVKTDGKTCVASAVSSASLLEHEGFIKEAEDALLAVRDKMSGSVAAKAPPIPEPKDN